MSIVRPGKRVEAFVPMTFSRISLSVAMLLALGAPAAAQMYPGEGIAVNPAAVGGGQVLLYPGGKYVRVVPQLLQPGAPYPGEPIHLHMPVTHHHAVARRKAHEPSIASASEPEISAPIAPPVEAPPPPAPVVVKHKIAAAPPPAAPEESASESSAKPSAAIPFSFGGPMPRGARSKPEAPAVQPKAESKQPTKVASIQPPPATTKNAVAPKMSAPGGEPSNLSKRSEILFPHNATDPTPEAAGRLKQLAGDLNSALAAGAQRVQLDAFGGAPGDKSTDARRVSLKRALVIRQLLIDAGVPSSRIDVRAMGGIDDSGNADRVDVYVRAG